MDANKFPGCNDYVRIPMPTDYSAIGSLLNEAAANDSSIQHGGAATISENHALGTNAEASKFMPYHEQPLPQEEADIEAEIAQCNRRLQRLRQLKKGKGVAVEPCKSEESAHRKKISAVQCAFRRNMEYLMDSGAMDGYVYAMIPKEGKPRSGCSESLRWWWKERVNFDRDGPAAAAKFKAYEASVLGSNEMIPEPVAPDSLHELPDNVLGSLLSSLMPHCDPPQRCFPLDKEISPPWWPTGGERWWHQFEMLKNLRPPPYKKPHDMKKSWKICVLIAVIKHIIPDIGKLVRLVRQSRCFQDKMSDKNVQILLGVVHREARLYMQEHPGVELPLSVLREGQGSFIFIDGYNSDLIDGREPEDPNSQESLGLEDGCSERKRKRCEPGGDLNGKIQEFQCPNMFAPYSMIYPQMTLSGLRSRISQADTTASCLSISADGQQAVDSLITSYNQGIRHGGGYLNPGEIHHADIVPMPQGFIDASSDRSINAAFDSSSNMAPMNLNDALPGRMEELLQDFDSPDFFW